MLGYNCIVVVVDGCISQVTLSGFHCYVLLNSDVIMIVHELIRKPVLVTYWLLNLTGAN